jgi:hypothetical protein
VPIGQDGQIECESLPVIHSDDQSSWMIFPAVSHRASNKRAAASVGNFRMWPFVVFPERDEATACGYFYFVSPACFGLHLIAALGQQ